MLGKIDASTCPPAVVSTIFPAFNGEAVTVSENEIIVIFETEQTPVDLGQLVKVELISQ